MTTSRVPGVTRNSGWQAVSSEIVEARALCQQQVEGGASPVPADHRPAEQRRRAVSL